MLTLWYIVASPEPQQVGRSPTVHGRLLTETLIDVHGTEEGDGHWEVGHVEAVREHAACEEVSVLQGQGTPVPILTPYQVAHLVGQEGGTRNHE